VDSAPRINIAFALPAACLAVYRALPSRLLSGVFSPKFGVAISHPIVHNASLAIA